VGGKHHPRENDPVPLYRRAGLDRWGKSRPQPVFDPRTFEPVASRCTDCAIAVPMW
jgi:hypothetical protein